jgi:hypothetical protein
MSPEFLRTEEYFGDVMGSLGYHPGGVFGEGWSPAQAGGKALEEMFSLWAQHSPGTDVTADPSSNHKLVIPSKKERIRTPASEGEGSYIMMLESLWHQLKIRFPFSDLQIEVLHNLHLAPTQLHPNGWGFLQTFEVFCCIAPRPCSCIFLVSIAV